MNRVRLWCKACEAEHETVGDGPLVSMSIAVCPLVPPDMMYLVNVDTLKMDGKAVLVLL